MKSHKSLAVVLLGASLLLAPLTHADENNRRAQVEQLLLEMHMDTTLNSMYDQMEQMLLNMQKQLNISEDEKPLFEEFAHKYTKMMREELSWDKMKQPLVDIYVKHYTDKEIADMAAFYASESGRSMVAKMPQVMQESMAASQSFMASILPKMTELQKEFAEKLKERRSEHSAH
ncbi:MULTISPECIES: DUF2059 domain-containing protein [Shewanella]|jgi:hypothetical protein|uniref:DUF2059 domain-containing protein n=1 Tax=Shewanella fodinae TaxID=552357 RepID=A0A4R2F7Q7_9GAMM|nr:MULTISPECIES: DUF2059 domain-containing protein [Shewanella]MDN5369187.1 uncharacterized protein [Shewanella sp.]MBO1272989.1 DUF2059 domain-containing protein [Shewanella sp. 4t3-1-2LB]MCL2906880.1 DUF2059 domain-containing protein [Shewanella fodinae]TCN83070.1 hypothetical protein EDC91_11650 [Shewanella fodinae]GGZ04228.1 hypothetical protein GCM10007169_21280 [Shewanella fodinae]